MSLFNAISISASGMDAQRIRAELISENLANADTTRTPAGGPYQRKDAIFTTVPFAQTLGVAVSEIAVDASEPERRYLPRHPDADPDGYVAFPKIDPASEMVDLMSASRSYQANVAAISSVKDMIARSIDLFR
jgi:flagellar basal-body rod protein FlgC